VPPIWPAPMRAIFLRDMEYLEGLNDPDSGPRNGPVIGDDSSLRLNQDSWPVRK
jgi:hypothetical protein